LSHFLSEAAKSSILHKRHPDFGRKRPPFSAKTRKSLCIPTNRIFRKNIFELVFLKRPESGVASDEAMRKAKKQPAILLMWIAGCCCCIHCFFFRGTETAVTPAESIIISAKSKTLLSRPSSVLYKTFTKTQVFPEISKIF
jgi:hypothetical protein